MKGRRPARTAADRRRGSQIVESMVILLPLFSLFLLTLDTAWGLFIKATIQHAVREGVRYAVTGQTGSDGQISAIQSVVQTQSMGLLPGGGTLYIHFLNPTTLADLGQTAGANQTGNVVEIDATYPYAPLSALFPSTSISFSATSSDVLQGYTGTTPPSL